MKAVNKICKDNKVKLSVKDKPKGFGFRYQMVNGRIFRKLVPSSDCVFKTDGKNSFTSKNKSTIRVGTRPQKYQKPPERAASFFHHNKQLFIDNDVDLDKCVVVNGCFDTNRVILERTAVPDVSDDTAVELPNEINMQLMKKAIKSVIRKLNIDTIETPLFNSVLSCKFNSTTKCGFTGEYICGFSNKDAAAQTSVNAAHKIWKILNVK